MVQMGVPDPCKFTRTTLQNAASIAGLVLTTDYMIARLAAAAISPRRILMKQRCDSFAIGVNPKSAAECTGCSPAKRMVAPDVLPRLQPVRLRR